MSDEQKTPDEPVEAEKPQRARIPEPEQFTGDPYGADVPPLTSSRINAVRTRRTIT